MIDMRTGIGYDVHAFCEGDHIWLGGVKINHTRGIEAHSDGDVALHALTDAVLGAISAGDIGDHFPPSDEQWQNVASKVFLKHALSLARSQGFQVNNVDITIISEAPKIGPHRKIMSSAIASILEIEETRVSIKATTNEKMGFLGRKEGLAAIALATLIKENS